MLQRDPTFPLPLPISYTEGAIDTNTHAQVSSSCPTITGDPQPGPESHTSTALAQKCDDIGERNAPPSSRKRPTKSLAEAFMGGSQTTKKEHMAGGNWIYWHACLNSGGSMDAVWEEAFLAIRAAFYRQLVSCSLN